MRPEGRRVTARPTDLVVNLAGGHGGVAEVFGVAVGRVDAAGGGNAVGRVIDAAGPAGVVVDAAAAQLGFAEGGDGGETDDVMAFEWRNRNQFLNWLFS